MSIDLFATFLVYSLQLFKFPCIFSRTPVTVKDPSSLATMGRGSPFCDRKAASCRRNGDEGREASNLSEMHRLPCYGVAHHRWKVRRSIESSGPVGRSTGFNTPCFAMSLRRNCSGIIFVRIEGRLISMVGREKGRTDGGAQKIAKH